MGKHYIRSVLMRKPNTQNLLKKTKIKTGSSLEGLK
ncbi:hypothetical protein MAR_012140 [Mya arenaria]|uniref:Uncharacterized protein n=1 Tax=Mya arenaria TaxID=6604 RepID=A0ABY7G0A5_MYAAR|nr:hypothetical protein MAR_012140 [Mya arenaria]